MVHRTQYELREVRQFLGKALPEARNGNPSWPNLASITFIDCLHCCNVQQLCAGSALCGVSAVQIQGARRRPHSQYVLANEL